MWRPSYQTPAYVLPNAGNRALPFNFVMDDATIYGELTGEELQGQFGVAQSVFIDNKSNTGNLDLILLGGPETITIRALPYSQGFYPLSWPAGANRFRVDSGEGQTIKALFYNYAIPYMVWFPTDGVNAVPTLTNVGLAPLALGVGDTVLIANGSGDAIKLYRGMFQIDDTSVIKFTDGAGGATLASFYLTPGGSATFQVSGLQWLTCSNGNDLVINSTVACNLYGTYGYAEN